MLRRMLLGAIGRPASASPWLVAARALRSSACRLEKALPPRPKIAEGDLVESFIHGSGPGGQKINKTASAVQLTHTPTGIVVKCQATRSRAQNRKIARQLLAEKLDILEKGEESRTAIKTERARRKKASADKKKRRKYKALDEGKSNAKQEDDENSDVNKDFDAPLATEPTDATRP